MTEERASVEIGDVTLMFRKGDAGGTHYYQRGHSEEYYSPFYAVLRETVDPKVCIDVGANYGYTGMLMRRAFPSSKLTLIEPIPWLADFIADNFVANGLRYDRFYSAIVSDSEAQKTKFGVNEKASQDSRVIAQPGWSIVETDVVTLDMLTKDVDADSGVYIKIDTQGWEERVFAGGRRFLSSHKKWFIKTEFAPQWMDSQGTDPVTFLRDLTANYAVHESPGRQRWNCSSLAELIGPPLKAGSEEDFVSYVRKLVLNGKGWVDLYVLPNPEKRGYQANSSGFWRNLWRR
ncbi:FkbM family methyltransferase [Neorhizobium sp. S3-V5DH]|uniref:FkbM family methyltransferase n=1 Tax=Neorhizobium sp. S3-V5DH TaxID=2485166 RepID=UPI000DD53272|nr:FkbM family methyltransferase [Neorhizobium sp. S3-V5DH]TCV66266.1 FkbM family methyltransferase [Neorhizobium sp. S3-V5DH]